MTIRIWAFTGSVFGLFGVVAGAMAAHAIPDPVAADMVRTAAFYALLHGGVLLCWSGTGRIASVAKAALALGVVLFSGALTLKYGLGEGGFGRLAPIGGGLLMGGWVLIILHSLSRRG